MARLAPPALLVPFTLAALAAVPGVAHADAKAEAQTRMEHATELYQQGKFAEALSELTIAYTLDPRPEMLYAIGQMHVQLGHCPEAILFYERFLSTKPDAVPAAAATEAIETCKSKPDAVASGKSGAEPAQPQPPIASKQPAPPPEQPPRWYADRVGAGLLGGGVVLGGVGLAIYVAARSDISKSETAPDYQTHADLIDSAHTKRTIAAVFGVAGAGLAGAAVVRYVLRRRADAHATVGVAPVPGGGLVTWSGRL
jgi:tetratricopeptide (TPR) repeat protein